MQGVRNKKPESGAGRPTRSDQPRKMGSTPDKQKVSKSDNSSSSAAVKGKRPHTSGESESKSTTMKGEGIRQVKKHTPPCPLQPNQDVTPSSMVVLESISEVVDKAAPKSSTAKVVVPDSKVHQRSCCETATLAIPNSAGSSRSHSKSPRQPKSPPLTKVIPTAASSVKKADGGSKLKVEASRKVASKLSVSSSKSSKSNSEADDATSTDTTVSSLADGKSTGVKKAAGVKGSSHTGQPPSPTAKSTSSPTPRCKKAAVVVEKHPINPPPTKVLESNTQTTLSDVEVETQTLSQENPASETQTLLTSSEECESQTVLPKIVHIETQTPQQMAFVAQTQTLRQTFFDVKTQTVPVQFSTACLSLPQSLPIKIVNYNCFEVETQTFSDCSVVDESATFLAAFFMSVVYQLSRQKSQSIMLCSEVQSNECDGVQSSECNAEQSGVIQLGEVNVSAGLLDVSSETPVNIMDSQFHATSLPFVPAAGIGPHMKRCLSTAIDSVLSTASVGDRTSGNQPDSSNWYYSTPAIVYDSNGTSYSLSGSTECEFMNSVPDIPQEYPMAHAWSAQTSVTQESTPELIQSYNLLSNPDDSVRWWSPYYQEAYNYAFCPTTEYSNDQTPTCYDGSGELGQPPVQVTVDELDSSPPSNAGFEYSNSMDATMMESDSNVYEKQFTTCDYSVSTPWIYHNRSAVQAGSPGAAFDSDIDAVNTNGEVFQSQGVSSETCEETVAVDSLSVNIDLSFLDSTEETVSKSVESIRSDNLFSDDDPFSPDQSHTPGSFGPVGNVETEASDKNNSTDSMKNS